MDVCTIWMYCTVYSSTNDNEAVNTDFFEPSSSVEMLGGKTLPQMSTVISECNAQHHGG